MEAHKNEGAERSDAPHEERAASDRLEKVDDAKKEAKSAPAARPRAARVKNNVRKLRMERMMSKAELARRAGLSTLTVDRVERGMGCRMDTKRKILEALGLKPQDRVMVFGDAEDD
jgi:DNA-binding XRE family transcriptional regulator